MHVAPLLSNQYDGRQDNIVSDVHCELPVNPHN